MSSLQQNFAKAAMQRLAETSNLNTSLVDVFSRILSRQVNLDHEGNPVGAGAFNTLLQVFTFVATPANEGRPLSPLAYGSARLETAITQARQEVLGDSDQNFWLASQSTSLVGQDGKQDFFIFDLHSDPTGAFARFGEVNLSQFNQQDGDRLVFVDQNNSWSGRDDLILADLQANQGNARLMFNNDPDKSPVDQVNSLTLEGISTAKPFANQAEDLQGVTVEVVQQSALDALGGHWQAYADQAGWLV